jgi:hypothetical protein
MYIVAKVGSKGGKEGRRNFESVLVTIGSE